MKKKKGERSPAASEFFQKDPIESSLENLKLRFENVSFFCPSLKTGKKHRDFPHIIHKKILLPLVISFCITQITL